MDMLFGKVFSMSLTASLAIIAVILARIPLRKLPKTISYWLWAVVLFRLLCPVTLPSPVSFVPENLAQHTVVSRWSDTVTLNSDFEYPSTVTAENTHSQPVTEPEHHKVDSPVETPAKEEKSVSLLASLWTLGIAGMAAYTAFSRIRVSRKTRYAIRMGKGIYVAEGIPSPFVLGIVNPKIFLPENLSEEEQAYVIIHENYHIRHLDHIVKFLFYIALCIHWFNPFVWVAFLLFSRDMEMRCDEAVMKKLGSGIRANYCYSILRLSARQPLTAISFGGSNTKSRIKNLAMPKKTGMGVIALALVFTITLSACLATNPVSPTDMTEDPTKSPKQIAVDLKEKEAELRAIEAALALKEQEKDQAIWNEWMDSMPNNLSLNVYFVDNDGQKDTFPTYTYEGEELHIKVNVGFTGISEVGLLLFLNGKPQPCRLNEDTKYSYMTILDRPGSPHTRLGNQDLYFVPVDGVQGETVNLEVVAIANPNYFLEDGPSGFQYTGMPAADAAKVTFLQDPITVSQPPPYQPGAFCHRGNKTTEQYRAPEAPGNG